MHTGGLELYLLLCVCARDKCVGTPQHLWRSEDNFWEVALSFHHAVQGQTHSQTYTATFSHSAIRGPDFLFK